MTKYFLFIFCSVFFFEVGSSFAKSSTKCEGLVDELRAMKKAEKVIMSSMVNQTKEVSSTLLQFSEKSSHPKQELANASHAFSKHHDREQMIVEKFEEQSAKLIDQISICLKTASNP